MRLWSIERTWVLVSAAVVVTVVAASIASIATAVVVARIALILRATDDVSTEGTETGTNGGTFKTPATLMADDSACSGPAESTEDGSRPGVRPVGAGDE